MKTNWAFALLMAASLARADDETILAGDTNRVPLTPAFLHEMAEVMRTNHPGLLALQARARAASHATQAVRTWEDPVGAYELDKKKRIVTFRG